MRTVGRQSLLQVVAFIIFIFSTQFTYSYASMDEENTINKIIESHGKKNIVNFILQRSNGKITIQKKKSFVNITGRPDIALVTTKSINYDLKNLEIDISKLETELDIYIEDQLSKQQKEDNLRKSASSSNSGEFPLSKKLKYEMSKIQSKYNEASSNYERKRLKRELSSIKRKYNAAKYNEKHNPEGSSFDKSRQNTRSTSYCDNYKSQLQKLTEASYRHQIFFCNDRAYRAENPKSCAKTRYSKQYSLQGYKDQLNKLRQNVSKHCGS